MSKKKERNKRIVITKAKTPTDLTSLKSQVRIHFWNLEVNSPITVEEDVFIRKRKNKIIVQREEAHNDTHLLLPLMINKEL